MLLAIQSHLKCLNMNFRFKCFKSSVHSRFSSERRKTWCDRLVSEVNIEKSKWHDRMNQREKQTLIDLLDLRYPHEWFPEARKQKRTLHCHLGGTNSGKTHSAVEALMNSNRGVYCAPLRLLAMEMWERIRLKSPCHLITGEIRIDAASPTRPKLDDSTCTSEDNSKCFLNLENIQKTDKEHVSCTVEMLDFAKSYDVAIIDEIQMVSDPQRGWAFTQALLGVNAKDVYLCGEEAILPIIESIAAMTGDTVTVKRFERLSPLTVESSSLKGNLSALLPGDCVVTFSRNSIFEARDLIFRETGRKCATVYGRLPLENRALQARLFNERLDKCDILVASDAIGMGLNL